VQTAMSTILVEAYEIIVKPFETGKLADLLRERVSGRKPAARSDEERVAKILQGCASGIVEDWLAK
jgi:hypothetical protein